MSCRADCVSEGRPCWCDAEAPTEPARRKLAPLAERVAAALEGLPEAEAEDVWRIVREALAFQPSVRRFAYVKCDAPYAMGAQAFSRRL